MLGDWLVVSQVLPVNPAAAVRGPTHVVTTGATPVLSPAEARRLLAAIDPGTLAGLRDRALVSVMLYSFARVSAVSAMRRPDYFRQERQGWLRLHEKGGTRHDVPAHHRAAEALDDYLARAGLDAATAALFQSVDPAGRRLTGRALSRRLVLAMIKRVMGRLAQAPAPAPAPGRQRGPPRAQRAAGARRPRGPGRAPAVTRFFTWCDAHGLALTQISPIAVATYIEDIQGRYRAPSLKQHLAAIRRLFD